MFWNRQQPVELPAEISQREQLHEDIPRVLADIRNAYEDVLRLTRKQTTLADSYRGLPGAYMRYSRLLATYEEDRTVFVNKWAEVDDSRLCQLLRRGSIDEQLTELEEPEVFEFSREIVIVKREELTAVTQHDINDQMAEAVKQWLENEPESFAADFNGTYCSYAKGTLVYVGHYGRGGSYYRDDSGGYTCTAVARFRVATEQIAAQRRELKSLNFALEGDSGISVLVDLLDSLTSLKSLAESLVEQLNQMITTLEREEIDELEELDELAEGALKLLDSQFRF